MYAHKLDSKRTSGEKIRLLTLTAMFAAITTAATALLKIGTPIGYVHAGDTVVYLAASVLPFPFGIIASAIGGSFADLMSGYAVWMLPTAIIKALNALMFTLSGFYLRKKGSTKIINIPNLLMMIPAAVVTVGGYFISEIIMYDLTAAVAEIIPNCVQALTASLLYVVIGLGLDSIKFKEKIFK